MDSVTYLKEQKERRITLNDFVMAYYDSLILPIEDELLPFLKDLVDITFEMNERLPYVGRINEYGNHLEEVMLEAIQEKYGKSVTVEKLGSGYPDLRINYQGKMLYPELKISKDIDALTTFRVFYTSTPKEITKNRKDIKNGYHVLFHFEHLGPGSLSGRFKVTDLNGFEYTALGNIQQGHYKDLYENHNSVILTEKSVQ